MLKTTTSALSLSSADARHHCQGARRVTFHRSGPIIDLLTQAQAQTIDELIEWLEDARELVNSEAPRSAAETLEQDRELEEIVQEIRAIAQELAAEGIAVEVAADDGSWTGADQFGDLREVNGREVRVSVSRA